MRLCVELCAFFDNCGVARCRILAGFRGQTGRRPMRRTRGGGGAENARVESARQWRSSDQTRCMATQRSLFDRSSPEYSHSIIITIIVIFTRL